MEKDNVHLTLSITHPCWLAGTHSRGRDIELTSKLRLNSGKGTFVQG